MTANKSRLFLAISLTMMLITYVTPAGVWRAISIFVGITVIAITAVFTMVPHK